MKKFALLCTAALLLASLQTRAATYTWSGAGFMGNQDFLWSNPFNWVGAGAPQTGETNVIIVLPNNGAPRTTTNDIAGLVIKSIRFQGDNYIVAGKAPGNSITLLGDRFNTTIDVTGNNGQFATSIGIVLTNDITVDVDLAKTLVSHAIWSGPGGFAKSGPGTLDFNAIGNNYGGDTVINDGTLDLHSGLFGPSTSVPGPLFIGSTNVALSPVVRLLADDQIADTAPVTVNASGQLWLNTHTNALASLTLAGGSVSTGSGGGPSNPGLLTLNGNVTNLTSAVGYSTIAGRLSLGLSSRTFNVVGSQLDITARISGAGLGGPGVTKIGPGRLVFYNPTNNYAGATLVQEGELLLYGGVPGSTNSGTTVSAGAQLQLHSASVLQEQLTLNGTVTNDVLTFIGSNFWGGAVSMPYARVYGATNETMNFNGPISGGTFKLTGRGNVYLTGSNANTVVDLIVDRGVAYLAKSPNVDAFGGRIFIGNTNDPQLQASVVVKANQQFPTMAPTTIFQSGVLGTDGADESLGNLTIQGGWLINIIGKFTLNGNVTNLYSVYNSFMAGDLALANFQRIFHCASNSTLYCGSTIADPGGNGGITKTGPGRLIFSDPNTYSGPTIVQDGFLVLENNGQPGGPGGGTEVFSPAVLQLSHANVTNEFLTLHGNANSYSLYVRDACSWRGNVLLLADSTIQFENANGLSNSLLIEGAITGAGGLRVDGDGDLTMSGNTDNTFAGPFWMRTSDALLQKQSGALAVSSSVRIGESNAPGATLYTLTLGANNQIANNAPVEVLAKGVFDMNTFSDAIGALTMSGGKIQFAPSLLTINGNITAHAGGGIYVNVSLGGTSRTIFTDPNTWLLFYGDIQDGGGASGITITGGGRVSFNYRTTYSGLTAVNASTLDLIGQATPGTSAAGTQISPGGHLNLVGVRVTNETLVLYGDAGSPQLTFETDSNVWYGSIQLLANTTFQGIPETMPLVPAQFLVNGVISGSGGLTLDGQSYVTFRGDSANTYAGPTWVKSGRLYVGKNDAVANNVAVPGNLTVGTTNVGVSAAIFSLAKNQFATGPAFRHVINPDSFLHCFEFDQRLPALTLVNCNLSSTEGIMTLTDDITVDDRNLNATFIYGRLSLGTTSNTNALRTISITNDTLLDIYADIRDGTTATNLLKTGAGLFWLEGSNTFNGTLTITEGYAATYTSNGLGSAVGGTIIKGNASLSIRNYETNTWHLAEPFVLNKTNTDYYSITQDGTNVLEGPIQTLAESDINVSGTMSIAGVISGSGGIGVAGDGLMRIIGTNNNTFAGTLELHNGLLDLAKTNAIAVPGRFVVGDIAYPSGEHAVRWYQSNQVADTSVVIITPSGQIELRNYNDTIGSLEGSGVVLLGSGILTTGGNGSSTLFDGFVSGIGGQLNKTGAGTMTLFGNNSYTGGSTVSQGVLLVNGNQVQSPITLVTGGQVGGNGRVGNISALNGHISPGMSPGKLGCVNASFFSPSSLFKIEIAGTNAGVNYDQLDVNGNVLLMGGAIQLAMNFPGAVSNQYVILKNNGAGPVSGTFAGLTNGASITNSGTIFVIQYNGGDGNDIVLIQQNVGSQTGPQFGGISQGPNGGIQLGGSGNPNSKYAVDATPNLNPPISWQVIGIVTADGSGHLSFTDTNAPVFPIRFYRFRLQ